MRLPNALTFGLVLALAGGPALAGDLVYRHDDRDGPDVLAGSDGRPYWLLLSECVGFYGALSNLAVDDQAADADLAAGRALLSLAVERVGSDRGLGRGEAISLIEPHIRQARQVGEASLARPSPADAEIFLTPEQVLRSTCGSLERVYRAQAG